MDKIYAPVKITTLHRYEHFKRCIESLRNCTSANETEVYIGIDYPTKDEHWPGYMEILNYVDTISGFKAVHIYRREYNFGLLKNSRDLVNRISKRFDRYIATEDDNEFSPNFLEYMNEGLEKYKDDSRVLMICGYNYMFAEKELQSYKYNVYPFRGMMAWGYGNWISKVKTKRAFVDQSRVKEYLHNRKLVSMMFKHNQHITIHRLLSRYGLQASGDLMNRIYIIANDKFCILPKKSKVRNWGFDGSGTNCISETNNDFEKQEIDQDKYFKYDDIEIRDYPETVSLYNRVFGRSWILRRYIELEYALFVYFGINIARRGTIVSTMRKRLHLFKKGTI